MVCQTDPSVGSQGCDESRVPRGETACAQPVWVGQGSLRAALGQDLPGVWPWDETSAAWAAETVYMD